MKYLATLMLAFLFAPAFSQGLKPLDFADILRDAGVWKETQYRVNYKDALPVDTCLHRVMEFDANGLMTARTDYFACGRVYSTERFEYDENHKLIANEIGHVFNQFEFVPFELNYDDFGRVISRTLDEPIRSFWQSENFIYDDFGTLTIIEQASMKSGELVVTQRDKFDCGPIKIDPKNTMSHIFDEHGLPILDNIYDKVGLHHAIMRHYEFR
jgi:hypothetical protein